MSIQIFGTPVARGVAIGRAVIALSSRVGVAHYFVAADAVDHEIDRLRTSRNRVLHELEHLKADLPHDAPGELSALLDVHMMLLQDESLSEATKSWIRERRYNAEWALSAQLEVLSRQFEEMEDEYLRERKADVEQVVERLLHALTATPEKGPESEPLGAMAMLGRADANVPLVLIANDIAPADMLQFKRSIFTGFVTDVGGRTSHTAIVARSLDIPAVVGAREASRLIRHDDWVIIDGDAGAVIVNPSPIVLDEYRYRQQESRLERARLDRLKGRPAVTLDGCAVELLANIELPDDAKTAVAAGAVGVGLFRSEYLFMNRGGALPGEDEQFESYRAAVLEMQGLPLTIRTIDIGADKPLDRVGSHDHRQEQGLNPALGLRAIRWSLAEPAMFREQLRAILRASAYGKVRVLIPMLAHRSEIMQTLEAIDRARQQLNESGHSFGDVQVGAMIEVPAAALMIDTFLGHFDFVSIGTNDLIQYTLAIDRADEAVSHLFDPWHPAVLRLIADVIRRATAAGRGVSVCGEMAGDPQFTGLLLAMGLRSFSMHPARIASVKHRLLRADASRLEVHLQTVLAADEPQQAAAALMA